MKLTNIDRDACRTLNTRIAELLKPLTAEFGVAVEMGAAKFGGELAH